MDRNILLRRLLVALALLAAAVPAYAQVPTTRSQLQTQNTQEITTNGQQLITGKVLNGLLGNFIASVATLLDPETFVGQVTFSLAPIFTGTGFVYANGSTPATYLSTIPSSALPKQWFLQASDFIPAGTLDPTSNLQAWINACEASGQVCFLNGGTYNISGRLLVNAGVNIEGAGPELSILRMTSNTQDAIDVTTIAAVYISGIGIQSAGTPSAGAGISIDPGGSNVSAESILSNIRMINVWNGISLARSSYTKMDKIAILSGLAEGFIIQDLAAPDSGDDSITNSLVLYGSATNNSRQVAVSQTSAGGLRLEDDKLLNGFRGYQFSLLAAASTGSMVTVGNSMENAFDSEIFISQQASGSGNISKWVIGSNELLSFGNAYGIRIFGTNPNTWFKDIAITGNVIQINGDGAGTVPHGLDITFATNIVVTGNMIECNAPGSGSFGVLIDANTNAVAHAGNNIQGCTTAVSDSSTNPYSGY